jgi:hypothetical protein
MPDYYPTVVRLLEEAGCYRVEMVRDGVEGWESPRTGGRFLVDNPIRAKDNGNNILRNAGLAPSLK